MTSAFEMDPAAVRAIAGQVAGISEQAAALVLTVGAQLGVQDGCAARPGDCAPLYSAIEAAGIAAASYQVGLGNDAASLRDAADVAEGSDAG
jgi:hypothetical protein